jgi:hypothetical protein
VIDSCVRIMYANNIASPPSRKLVVSSPSWNKLPTVLNLYAKAVSNSIGVGEDVSRTILGTFRFQGMVLSGLNPSGRLIPSKTNAPKPVVNSYVDVIIPGTFYDNEIDISAIETSAKLYTTESQLVVNPIRVNIFANFQSSVSVTMSFSLVSQLEQLYDTLGAPANSSNPVLQTFCHAGVARTDQMVCPSGAVISHVCNGTELIKETQCPDKYLVPLCSVLQSTGATCNLANYSGTVATCSCQMIGSPASTSISLEVGVNSAYVYGEVNTEIILFASEDPDDAEESFYIPILIGVMWVAGILLMYRFFRKQKRSRKSKQKVGIIPSSPVRSPFKPTQELVMDYVVAAIPGRYLLPGRTLWDCMQAVTSKHRYFRIVRSSDKGRFQHVAKILTHLSMSICLLAIIYALQVSLVSSIVYVELMFYCCSIPRMMISVKHLTLNQTVIVMNVNWLPESIVASGGKWTQWLVRNCWGVYTSNPTLITRYYY